MHTLRRAIALGALGSAVLAASACSSTSDPQNAPPPSLSGSVLLPLDSISVLPGEHRQLNAEVHDVHGNLLTGQSITWSTTNDLKAIVTLTGELIAVSEGTVFIKASALNSNADSMKVVVRPKPVTNVDLVPGDSLVLEVGLSSQLQVLLRDVDGTYLAGRVFAFATEDANKVEITTSGRVTAVRAGRVRVSATSEGVTGYTTIVSSQPSRDFVIRSAQITQAVQAADNSIPMILNGNAAAVNVLVGATPFHSVPMDIQLKLIDASGTVVHTQTATVTGSPGTEATYASASAQFLVPQQFVRGDLRWQIVRDPLGRVADDSTANDVFPRSGPTPIAAVTVPAVKVRLVPIELTSNGSIVGNVGIANVEEYVRAARTMLPIGTLTPSLGTTVTSAQIFGGATGNPPVAGGSAAFYSGVLADLDLARTLSAGDPEVYWYGIIPAPPGISSQFGGMGYVPANPQSTGPQTRSAVGLHIPTGALIAPDFGTTALAYGLGLNFGRRAAPCGVNTPNPDPGFPTANGTTGVIGHDVRSWATGRSGGLSTQPATAVDIMGPCTGTRWVSEYTYRGILTARGFTASLVGGGVSSVRTAAQPVTRVLVVRGTVLGDRTVEIAPAFATEARPTAPERTGAYHLEGRDADGGVLFARDFDPVAPEGAPGYLHFTFAIPVSAAVESAVATIEVRGPAGTARTSKSIARGVAPRPLAAVVAVRDAGGLVTVACADPGTRGVLVRDANTGDLLGTASGASARVKLAAQTQINVLCSDGVASVQSIVVVR